MPDAPISSEMAINIVVVIANGIHCLIVCESDCLIILDGMRKKIIVNKQVIPSQNPVNIVTLVCKNMISNQEPHMI